MAKRIKITEAKLRKIISEVLTEMCCSDTGLDEGLMITYPTHKTIQYLIQNLDYNKTSRPEKYEDKNKKR